MPRYDGGALANAKPKSLLRLLRGTAAEGAVPLLLAARNGHLAAAAAAAVSQEAAKLAQKLGQLQSFVDVFPQECMGRLASFGPI